MRSFFHFFLAALKNPLQVSTLFETGPTAAQMLTDTIVNLGDDKVVELGVGTGAITKSLLGKLNKPSNYVGLELNTDMIKFAQERFPQVRFIEDSAENFVKYLDGKKASAVVSSLPWSLMPPEVVQQTLDAIVKNLKLDGVFATYMTLHVLKTPAGRRFQALLSEKFESLESQVVLENLPPAKIFFARKI